MENLIDFGSEDSEHSSDNSSSPTVSLSSIQPLQDESMPSVIQMLLEQQRRREEEQRRRDEEQRKREDSLLELIRKMSERQDSQFGSGTSVSDAQEFKRRTTRSFESITLVLTELQDTLEGTQDTIQLSTLATKLQAKLSGYEQFYESKVDLLDGDEEKDKAILEWRNLQSLAEKEITRAQVSLEQHKLKSAAGALPEGVKVPSFSGDMMVYPQWWDEFRVVVHENQKVSTFYKMQYLKSAMKGDASHVLDGVGVLAENYETAVTLIQQRFGRKRVITRHLVRSLAQMESVEMMEAKQFLALTDKLSARYATLKSQIKEVDEMLIPLLEDKLPTDVRQMWERHLGTMVKDDGYATSGMFFDFIRQESAARIASADHFPKNGQKQTEKPQKTENKSFAVERVPFSAAALATSTQSVNQVKAKIDTGDNHECETCGKGTHAVVDCSEFLSLTPNARCKVIESQRRCRVCFKKGSAHTDGYCSNECSNKGCSYKHHPLLCNFGVTQEVISNSCMTQKIVGNCVVNQKVLLPTAVASLRSDKGFSFGRIGFDSFSQSTFITTTLAKKLKLKLSKPETMTIRGFGGKPSTRSFKRAELEVMSKNGTKGIQIQAIVCNGKICDTLAAVTFDPKEYNYLENIELVEELPQKESMELDLLIGADYFGLFVESMTAAPSAGLPFVIKTLLGNVLAGPYPMNSPKGQSCLLIMRNCHPGQEKNDDYQEDQNGRNLEEEVWKIRRWQVNVDSEKKSNEQKLQELSEENQTFRARIKELDLRIKSSDTAKHEMSQMVQQLLRQLQIVETRLINFNRSWEISKKSFPSNHIIIEEDLQGPIQDLENQMKEDQTKFIELISQPYKKLKNENLLHQELESNSTKSEKTIKNLEATISSPEKKLEDAIGDFRDAKLEMGYLKESHESNTKEIAGKITDLKAKLKVEEERYAAKMSTHHKYSLKCLEEREGLEERKANLRETMENLEATIQDMKTRLQEERSNVENEKSERKNLENVKKLQLLEELRSETNKVNHCNDTMKGYIVGLEAQLAKKDQDSSMTEDLKKTSVHRWKWKKRRMTYGQ